MLLYLTAKPSYSFPHIFGIPCKCTHKLSVSKNVLKMEEKTECFCVLSNRSTFSGVTCHSTVCFSEKIQIKLYKIMADSSNLIGQLVEVSDSLVPAMENHVLKTIDNGLNLGL